MNRLEYYNRQKDNWGDKELQDIRTEYEINEMTISQIADIHHRTPGSISYKLKNLGLITHNTLSRGYLEYKNSNLYKQIVENAKTSVAENKINKEVKLKAKTESLSVSIPFKEILDMRNEMADLKKDIRPVLILNCRFFSKEQWCDNNTLPIIN
jgi:hypothetical protein